MPQHIAHLGERRPAELADAILQCSGRQRLTRPSSIDLAVDRTMKYPSPVLEQYCGVCRSDEPVSGRARQQNHLRRQKSTVFDVQLVLLCVAEKLLTIDQKTFAVRNSPGKGG